MSQCEYCLAEPAPYRITEEDGQRIFLCHECRADVEYCARGGKPEPEEEESEVEVNDTWAQVMDIAIHRNQDVEVTEKDKGT